MKDKCPCPSFCSCYFKSIANNVRRLHWLIEHRQPQIKLPFFFFSLQMFTNIREDWTINTFCCFNWSISELSAFNLDLVAPKYWLWINLHKVNMLHTLFTIDSVLYSCEGRVRWSVGSQVFSRLWRQWWSKSNKKKVCFLHTGHEQRYNHSEVETAINNGS